MIDFLILLACVLTRLFRSRAEILVLRHELNILQRKSTEERPSASILVPPRPASAAASVVRIELFAAKSDMEFLGVFRVCKAEDDPPLVLVEDAVMPLAHRQVEAEGFHEPAVRTGAVGRRDSDLMRPAAINSGRG